MWAKQLIISPKANDYLGDLKIKNSYAGKKLKRGRHAQEYWFTKTR